MAQTLTVFFDDATETRLRALRDSLDAADVPVAAGRPSVTLASASAIPATTRKALRAELGALFLPDLWFYTLGTFPGEDAVLLLTAVVDAELLAVHSAVHDVLAGKVTNPSAYYFPGAWIPHCALTPVLGGDVLTAGFAALRSVAPVRAAVSEVAVLDSRTGDAEVLVSR
ncbi:2'-5' RNA ligase family protein [Saccharopolyspora gloriosae]|uniref:2'-5' RNA ligase family protein n=1 Tax=Saccharopolyspora gloriosae TaxID=455344 RepID=UPI001FB7E6B9|nr:2'-5' RNA ligase family protein [Saccharopolyspora gloriosae]